jgi:hypothetical protein
MQLTNSSTTRAWWCESMRFDGVYMSDRNFDLEEVSNGVFRLTGKHSLWAEY